MIRLTRTTVLFCLSLAGTACTEPGPFRLEMSVDRTELKAADSVAVALELINQGWAPRTIASPEFYGYCIHAFQVFDAQRREVSVNTAFCIALATSIAYSPIELGPGASVKIRDFWRPSSSVIEGRTPGTGKYQIVGRVQTSKGAVRSAPAELTLVP